MTIQFEPEFHQFIAISIIKLHEADAFEAKSAKTERLITKIEPFLLYFSKYRDAHLDQEKEAAV